MSNFNLKLKSLW